MREISCLLTHQKNLRQSEIVENGYNLNIPRYVDTFEEEEPVDLEAARAEIKRLDDETRIAIDKVNSILKELKI